MKATIYCPGPHLKETAADHDDSDSVVIAVNDAAGYRQCDWLAACDWQGIVVAHQKCNKYGIGSPRQGVVSYADAFSRRECGRDKHCLWLGDGIQWIEAMDLGKQMHVRWHETYQYAITLAVFLRCTEASVFGNDMHGSVRWDGEDRISALPMGPAHSAEERKIHMAQGRQAVRWESSGENGAKSRYARTEAWASEQGLDIVNYRKLTS